ncbi:hypothetical protein ACKKBG_A14645 [Auxenochlorella protothecoides x Auxenochlorella symbiontica]
MKDELPVLEMGSDATTSDVWGNDTTPAVSREPSHLLRPDHSISTQPEAEELNDNSDGETTHRPVDDARDASFDPAARDVPLSLARDLASLVGTIGSMTREGVRQKIASKAERMLKQLQELAGREAALLTEVRQLHRDRKAWLDERRRLKAQVVALRTAARADQEQSESLAQTVKVLLQQQSQVLSR